MNWKKLKSMVGPPKTRKTQSLWTNLSSKHSLAHGQHAGHGGLFPLGNEVSSVHQCHEWCEDERVYVHRLFPLSSIQLSSVAQLCPTLCDPMNCSIPVHHQHPESESVMPSNHLTLRRPLLLLPSIFPSIRVFFNESVLRIRWPKYWSFSFNISLPMHTQDWSPLEWTGWISLQSKGVSRVFSNITVQKYHFCTQLFLWSNSHIYTRLLEKP